MLTYAEFCAGYGGLGLAVEEVLDAELRWYSEFDPAPSKILAHHWPDAPNHGDMTKIDWAAVEPVDVLSGGTPCQDLPAAGRRQGMTDGTRSNLWVNMREAIAAIKPQYVIWENVRGAYSAKADSSLESCPGCVGDTGDAGPALRALGRVLGDLSELGYDCQWRGLRAADVGACHSRYRVFVLATDTSSKRGRESDFPANQHAPRLNRATLPNESDPRLVRPEYDWAQYADAIAHQERLTGRPAPMPTEPTGRNNTDRTSPAFGEWMMGLPAGWVTNVPDLSWAQQWKAIGNGVAPFQAAAALRDMLTTNKPLESIC